MTTRFADFTLDPATRRLLRSDVEVHLSPKAFDLLTLLVRNRTQAMSKGDLQAALWPSTYVLETNLAGLVAEIRRALDDPAEAPRFIRTVPRFGYWFIGTVADQAAVRPPDTGGIKSWVVWDQKQIALGDGENILGRSPDAQVWIDASGVSRHHARIRLSGGAATVEDLGSKNGTFLRGQRITSPLPIADGDQIRLGSVVLTFRIPRDVNSTETVRSEF